ncbi:chemotaxis response regulator protein-glutamate methylesterase [Mariprofundus erugo]|uniref:protein-glutamate methylesterase n=1 Tax=Mariprofundus erugo TaxID=2528639 RepID=A0A5R9GVD3_9PROT|nr:chemotaxis protein CheB [Mariprofundus erugo]TLS67952.1 chemotaxis response regulator protein-glutamate methylesterase [Mariprofundus erugo]TLS76716.1 chemotaxis response regulator protein-glutamate methylesterase [Mariprofundus erugo]
MANRFASAPDQGEKRKAVLRVLVIEGDANARMAMVDILSQAEHIEVVGVASDPMMARMQVKVRKPELLVLGDHHDTEQTEGFLNYLAGAAPMPVVLLSERLLPSGDVGRQAIRAGWVALLLRPAKGIVRDDRVFADKLIRQVRETAVKYADKGAVSAASPAAVNRASKLPPTEARPHHAMLDKIIAIGASTGGTEALRQVVAALPADLSAVLIVQHIPKVFAASFIDRLDQSTAMRVVAASDGLQICKGHIYVGAGDQHFYIEKQGAGFVCRLGGQDKVSGHCPSVNVLFDSVAQHAGAKAVGALMTGMGEDGAAGLKNMRSARARTVAQDKDSSVVWGMPGAAVKIGAAEEQIPLHAMGEKLVQLVRG